MLRKYLFVLIAFAAFCAWGIAPNWSDVSARSLNQSIPIDETDPADAPTNPTAPIPAVGLNAVIGPIIPNGNIALTIQPSTPTFTRGGIFSFIARAFNFSANTLRGVVVRFVVPAFTFFEIPGGVQSAAVGDFTCQNGGVAGDVCAYELGDLEAGATEEFEIPLTVSEDYPDNGVDSLTLQTRIDGANDTDGIFETNRNSGTVLDEEITIGAEVIESDEVEILAPEGQSEATINPETNTVSVPLGFVNTSEQSLENVVLSAQLPEGATLPEGSPWTCNDSGTCIQTLSNIEPGATVNAPFVFIGNNINAGDPIEIPTRLDAQQTADGTVTPVQLQGTVAVQLTPTSIEGIDEPVQDQKMFLPLIQTN